jgi:hypothetical protein
LEVSYYLELGDEKMIFVKIRRKDRWSLWIVLLCIVITTWVILPPSQGRMPMFYDDNGNVISGSISEKLLLMSMERSLAY